MKIIQHLCFTSHNEVMFRNAEDVGMFINFMALSAFHCDSKILVDTEMSTHVHLVVLSSDPAEFVNNLRKHYTKYFNNKYLRNGRLGERGYFRLVLEGKNHICTAMSYVLRNGLHHWVSSTPFGYPFSSIKSLFAKDLGNIRCEETIVARNEIAERLPRGSRFPDEYVMNSAGIFIRESFEEIEMVQSYYVSPRAFLYNMNRLSGEEWAREQERDGVGGAPVTLDNIEASYSEKDRLQMLKAEKGHSFNRSKKNDFEICEMVDSIVSNVYRKESIYQLSDSQKSSLVNRLRNQFLVPAEQAARVLAI